MGFLVMGVNLKHSTFSFHITAKGFMAVSNASLLCQQAYKVQCFHTW